MKNKIGISNADFAIAQIIRQVSFQIVWFREMMRNALEATDRYLKDNPNIKIPLKIKVRAKRLLGLFIDFTAPKLSVLNYKGMTKLELLKALQLFCEVDKVQDFLRNFGIGMKITLTRFSDVAIITHKDGEVHYVVIGLDKRGQLVVLNDVEEITDWAYDYAEERGYDMEHEWTEVILLGKGPKQVTQNTLTHTFDADRGQEKIHVLKSMFTRFVDIPKSIDVVFETGESGKATPHNGGPDSGNVKFKTREELWDRAMKNKPETKARKQTVTHKETGVKVTLIYDAPTTHTRKKKDGSTEEIKEPFSHFSEARQATSSEFTGIVWGDSGMRERYDIIDKNRWKKLASDLGIYNDYKYFKIEVELPFRDYEPSMDRSKLQKREFDLTFENPEVSFKDFVPFIKDVMNPEKYPETKWFDDFRQYHNSQASTQDRDELIKEYLDEFYKDQQMLKQEKKGPKKSNGDKDGMPDIDFSPKPLECPKCKAKSINTPMPKGQKTCTVCGYERKTPKKKPRSTEDVMLDVALPEFMDASHLAEHFANYTYRAGQRDLIQTNRDHTAVDNLAKLALQGEYSQLDSENRDKVREDAYKMLQVQAGVTTVIALARAQSNEWFSQQALEAITSEEHYTFEALQPQNLVHKVKETAKRLLKEQKQFANVNKDVVTNGENALVIKNEALLGDNYKAPEHAMVYQDPTLKS